MRVPIPVWQREALVAGQLPADALEIQQVDAMPRQPEPVPVDAFVEVDLSLPLPASRVARRQSFHRCHGVLIGCDDRIRGIGVPKRLDILARGAVLYQL